MRSIVLRADKPFYNNCDVAIIDVTDGKEKRRGKIKIEYAKVDVDQLKKQGMTNLDQAMEHYRDSILAHVRAYISDEPEWVEGHEEVMDIIEDHIRQYYSEPQDR